MRNITLTAAAFLLFALLSCGGNRELIRDSQFDEFTLEIEQNDILIQPANGAVSLSKSPFSIIIKFDRPGGVFINASFNESSLTPARNGVPEKEINGFKGAIIAEGLFNQDEALTISDNSPSYWYYTKDDDHRFSSVRTDAQGVITCKRRVTGFSIYDKSESLIDINDVAGRKLYLTVIKIEWNYDFTSKIEKKRDTLIIDFERRDPPERITLHGIPGLEG